MDLPVSGAPAASNTSGTTTPSGLPIAANTSAQQVQKTIAPTQSAPAEQQTAFNDALLSILNGLLQGQGKEAQPLIVAGAATDKSDEKKGEESDTTLADRNASPQQMLDTLLMASQQPIKPVTLSSMPTQTGENLLMNHRSGANGNGGIAPLMSPVQTASAPSAIDMSAQPTTAIPKGMQTVVPQPLLATLTEGPAPVNNAIPAAGSATLGAEKTPSFQTQLATVKLDGGEDRLAQQLHAVLGERLQVQVKNQIQHATIRLDPPDMGKIDISMQIENGRMQVHINASQGEVYRALQQVSNDLRQSLTEQNFVQVNVQVSSQSGQQQGGKEQPFSDSQAAVLAAAEQENDSQRSDRREDDSVLLTV
ncbi:MAG TPA: flagellar hook-length control protein FliK [Buttiauxella sp.]|jgi:flagellar hook-length control protein FliK